MKVEQSSAAVPRCYLVTGVAGFIASKVAEMLLAEGHTVVGVDNLNDYYDVRLKDWRLSRLLGAGSWEPGADPKNSIYAGVGRIIPNPPGSEKQSGALGTQPRGEDGMATPWPEADRHGRPVGNAWSTTRPTFEFHHLDIENLPALDALFSAHNFAAVFNLAARAGVRYSLEFPELYQRTNVLGEENVLKCQVKFGVKKHVLASSSSVYAGCPMPFVEDAVLGKMQSPYAETKRQAELLALDYHQKHGIDVTALRYFTVFGPAGRPDMAPFRFIKWIDEGTPITLYGDGTQARDFTYVDDIARGTVLAGRLFGGQLREQKAEGGKLKAESSEGTADPQSNPKASLSAIGPATADGFSVEDSSFDIINLGGGNNPLTITAMIGIIEKALSAQRALKAESGKLKAEGSAKSADSELNPQLSAFSSQLSVKALINRLPPSPADMKETWADITKAKRLLGWSPQITPEEGFRKTVDWYLANRRWLGGIKL